MSGLCLRLAIVHTAAFIPKTKKLLLICCFDVAAKLLLYCCSNAVGNMCFQLDCMIAGQGMQIAWAATLKMVGSLVL